jgi:hypothetical protein
VPPMSSLRIASIMIQARERAGDHPVSTSMGRPKRVLCPRIVLTKHDSNIPILRDVAGACNEKGMLYLDSVLEQTWTSLRLSEIEIRSLVYGRSSGLLRGHTDCVWNKAVVK